MSKILILLCEAEDLGQTISVIQEALFAGKLTTTASPISATLAGGGKESAQNLNAETSTGTKSGDSLKSMGAAGIVDTAEEPKVKKPRKRRTKAAIEAAINEIVENKEKVEGLDISSPPKAEEGSVPETTEPSAVKTSQDEGLVPAQPPHLASSKDAEVEEVVSGKAATSSAEASQEASTMDKAVQANGFSVPNKFDDEDLCG